MSLLKITRVLLIMLLIKMSILVVVVIFCFWGYEVKIVFNFYIPSSTISINYQFCTIH